MSSENEYLWGSKEAPFEGPSGEDNCLDKQWGFCGPNASFKMKGRQGPGGPKMAAYFGGTEWDTGINPWFGMGAEAVMAPVQVLF